MEDLLVTLKCYASPTFKNCSIGDTPAKSDGKMGRKQPTDATDIAISGFAFLGKSLSAGRFAFYPQPLATPAEATCNLSDHQTALGIAL